MKERRTNTVGAPRLLPWLAVLCLTGCSIFGSSPSSDFYVLSPTAGPALTTGPLSIQLRRPHLPAYLNRPEMVRRASSGRLELRKQHRWGAPLPELVTTTLIEDLARRLPQATVFAEAGAISGEPDLRVELDITRFEPGPDERIHLVAQVALDWKTGQSSPPTRVDLDRPAPSGASEQAQAMSELLAALAQAVAEAIATSRPTETVAEAPAGTHRDRARPNATNAR